MTALHHLVVTITTMSQGEEVNGRELPTGTAIKEV